MKHTRIIVTHYGGRRKRVVPYSNPVAHAREARNVRQDVMALFELLQQSKIKPLVAHRLPLADARHAHELLGKDGVIGKIVLVPGS